MLFSSFIFIFFFLPLTIICYYLVPKKTRNFVLLFFSILFYMWGEPIYIFIMLFSTLFDYINGIFLDYFRNKNNNLVVKIILIISIVGNLGILTFFKYSNFLVNNLENILNVNINFPLIVMPIGISFYTFQTMSYTIDVYKGIVPVQKNIWKFATYVMLFPQLIAGPIIKYSDIYNDLDKRRESFEMFSSGIKRFIIGLFKKVVLANSIGSVFVTIKSISFDQLSFFTAWIGALAFTFQIYYDFSGYSDMAIGIGKMFGFNFKENFNYPYMAKNITDFWRRWHISLSTWFKEYVYIPLGGNKKHKNINLMIVWLLTGLWHGASWNFVFWGAYFGILLILEKNINFLKKRKTCNIWAHIFTMILIIIGWVFFFSENLSSSFLYLEKMFLIKTNIVDKYSFYLLFNNLVLFIICFILSTDKLESLLKNIKNKFDKPFIFNLAYIFLFILSIAFLAGDTYNPFLYFRF